MSFGERRQREERPPRAPSGRTPRSAWRATRTRLEPVFGGGPDDDPQRHVHKAVEQLSMSAGPVTNDAGDGRSQFAALSAVAQQPVRLHTLTRLPVPYRQGQRGAATYGRARAATTRISSASSAPVGRGGWPGEEGWQKTRSPPRGRRWSRQSLVEEVIPGMPTRSRFKMLGKPYGARTPSRPSKRTASPAPRRFRTARTLVDPTDLLEQVSLDRHAGTGHSEAVAGPRLVETQQGAWPGSIPSNSRWPGKPFMPVAAPAC